MGLTTDRLLHAYANGIFPMARRRDSAIIEWMDPSLRGILPLDKFHTPKRLLRKIRQMPFSVRCDSAFESVIEACATPGNGRQETWINAEITRLFADLHHKGLAHSIECWRNGKLVGGLYGLAFGAAFFGESMFSIEPDASKVALVHLVARLRYGRFMLLDTQYVTHHLLQFGAREIEWSDYRALLRTAIASDADFHGLCDDPDTETVLQLITQTS